MGEPAQRRRMVRSGSLTIESDFDLRPGLRHTRVSVHLLTSVASAYAEGYGETGRGAWSMPRRDGRVAWSVQASCSQGSKLFGYVRVCSGFGENGNICGSLPRLRKICYGGACEEPLRA